MANVQKNFSHEHHPPPGQGNRGIAILELIVILQSPCRAINFQMFKIKLVNPPCGSSSRGSARVLATTHGQSLGLDVASNWEQCYTQTRLCRANTAEDIADIILPILNSLGAKVTDLMVLSTGVWHNK